MTLYHDLGVRRTASAAAIKRAYYQRSKTAHPDGGGSAEAFHRINRAWRVLSDPAARARYDQDGAVPEMACDNDASRALSRTMEALAQAFNLVASRLVANGCVDLASADVLTEMRAALTRERERIDQSMRQSETQAAMLESLAARVVVKGDAGGGDGGDDGDLEGGGNRIAAMLRGQAADLRQSMAAPRDRMARIDGALAELKRYRLAPRATPAKSAIWMPDIAAPNQAQELKDLLRGWGHHGGE